MFDMIKINDNINRIVIVISHSSLQENEKKQLSLFLMKISSFFATINDTTNVLANLNFYNNNNEVEH